MTQTYAPQAGIDETTETFHVNSFSFVKCLDFWVLLNWYSIEFIPHSPNEAAVIKGDLKSRKKCRFSAVLGSARELENKIYRDMVGRLARLRQMKCTFFDAVYVLTLDFMEIWLLGHSFGSLYCSWARMPLHDAIFRAKVFALSLT